MATTTNYSWSTPDNTAYVKDGASAIRTLGSSVDTTLFTALGGTYPGLRLIKKQTIGTAVSSVNVTGAFSATYDAYKIIVTGGANTSGTAINFRVGNPGTGFFGSLILSNVSGGTPTSIGTNNQANWLNVGGGSVNGIRFFGDLVNPFLAKNTYFTSSYEDNNNVLFGTFNGLHSGTTSFTDFTITSSAGTFTGGTIYVYGYGAS
jgi:hypothetical protein